MKKTYEKPELILVIFQQSENVATSTIESVETGGGLAPGQG